MAPVSSVGVGNAPVSSEDMVWALLGGVADEAEPASRGAAAPGDPGAGPIGAAMAAMLLGLPENGAYAVLALTSVVDGAGIQGHGEHWEIAQLAWAAGGLRVGDGMRAVWRVAPAASGGAGGGGPHVRAHAIVHLGDAALGDLVGVLDPSPGLRVGVSPAVVGPVRLPRARVLAERALRGSPDAPVAVLEDRLPSALVADSPDLARLLIERALGPVLELPPPDRDSLLNTLRAWLESGGSTRRAGDRLFYHPNTVLNRLRRYEQLTGRLLGDPLAVVELSLALDAYRIAHKR